jgi:hypothetical protein
MFYSLLLFIFYFEIKYITYLNLNIKMINVKMVKS